MDDLRALYDTLPGPTATARWETLAGRLNKIAGRHWTGTYCQSVANGTIPPTKTMRRAVAALAASYDGLPGHLATAVPASTFSAPDNDIAGAYVMGRAASCEKCGSKFVGSVPWRRFCPSCRPPRPVD